MKNRVIALVLCLILSFVILPAQSKADTGPKPSVKIKFDNLSDELCYGTLLSKHESTGPASVWDGDPEHIYNYDLDMDIWQAFVDYKDSDGFYFLQTAWRCDQTKSLDWTYYPPSPFKVLLYYPNSNTFTVSGIYERYAFDSYFTATLNGDISLSPDNTASSTVTLDKSYDYKWELISFGARVVICVIIEVAIALLFRLNKKRYLVSVLCANVVTQFILNLLLNIINYRSGSFSFVFWYVIFEIIAFAIEAVLYTIIFSRSTDETKPSIGKTVTYTAVANIASLIIGIAISHLIPGIF